MDISNKSDEEMDVLSTGSDIAEEFPLPSLAGLVPTLPGAIAGFPAVSTASFHQDCQVSMPVTREYDTVWDSDYLSCEIDEKGKPRWNCKHCGGTWSGHNHTKALYHVCKVPGANIKPCRGVISEDYSRRYQKVLAQKVKGADSRKKQENIIHLDLDRREDDTLAFLQMAKSSRPRS